MKSQQVGSTVLLGTLACILLAGCAGVGSRPVQLSLAEPAPRPAGQLAASTKAKDGETAANPVVRSQSGGEYGSNWGGNSGSAGTDATRYPMPVSGQTRQAVTSATTGYDNSYNSQAQFTNPNAAAQGSQLWPATGRSAPPPPPVGYAPANSGWDATVPQVSQLPETALPTPPPANYGQPPVNTGQPQYDPPPPPIGGWPQAFGAPRHSCTGRLRSSLRAIR